MSPQGKEEKLKLTQLQTTIRSSLTMLATTLATAIKGTGGKGSMVGTQFGAMIGTNIMSQIFKDNAWLVSLLGPVGALAGGLLGGIFGSRFDKKREPEKPLTRALVDNTSAVMQNTIALKELDKAIFNPPTRYNVPIMSGGFGGSIVINVTGGGNSQEIANAVRTTLEDLFDEDTRIYGTRGYVPI